MALPTVTGSWSFSRINQVLTTQASVQLMFQKLVWGIKDSLVNSGVGWTVTRSSDGSTADGTDRWLSYSNLSWHTVGSARSWVVLKHTGGGATGWNILIDCLSVGTAPYYLSLAFSTTDFTGGSTTAAPTSTNTIFLSGGSAPNSQSYTPWFNGEAVVTPVQCAYHVFGDATNGTTIVSVYSGYVLKSCWIFAAPTDKVSGFTSPLVTVCANPSGPAIGSASTEYTSLFDNTYIYFRHSSTNRSCYMTCEGVGYDNSTLNYLMSIPNEIDSNWPILPVGMYCPTSGVSGRHARFENIWSGSKNTPEGSTYGTKQFIQNGLLIFPWDGSSTPIIA